MTQPPLKLPDTAPSSHALPDGRLNAPSAERNAAPIFERLAEYVPDRGMVLELASGTGQHIAALAGMYPDVVWQPSDASGERMDSINAWRAHTGADNLRDPVLLDASKPWPDFPDLRLVYLVNLFHLIPQDDAVAVIRGAAGALAAGGYFFVYGPFRTDGAFRSEGDAKFHASLNAQNPLIGYKDLEWIEAELCAADLSLVAVHQMPANNLVIVAQKPA
ncbi:DUF938 domain-containing protein [Profundibacter sp.]